MDIRAIKVMIIYEHNERESTVDNLKELFGAKKQIYEVMNDNSYIVNLVDC